MWELIAAFERVRDAMAARDEAIQRNVRAKSGLRASHSIADVRTRWETKGAQYLRKRPDIRASVIKASSDFDREAARLIEETAPALAEAFDQELSNIASNAWREWPKQSGYSRSQIRVQVLQAAPTIFLGRVESAAPYTSFIKGNPARVLLLDHGNLAAERIAKVAGVGIVARFNRKV